MDNYMKQADPASNPPVKKWPMKLLQFYFISNYQGSLPTIWKMAAIVPVLTIGIC